ncbi:MAG TPA: PIN domain-containing protein [Vicinamibacteria bacterium]|nr:PIN domain-containing protein [Vicinamibacteria bacterium]
MLIDVNVVLDFVLDRPRFAEDASALWASAERKEIEAVVPAHGVTTVFHLARRQGGPALARRVVSDLLAVSGVAAVDAAVLRRALALGWRDFEDAVCAAAAEAAGCDTLVTRDPEGYPGCSIVVVDPSTAVSLLRPGPGPGEVAERPSSTPRRRRAAPSRSARRR